MVKDGITIAGAEGVYCCKFSLDDDYFVALYLNAEMDNGTSRHVSTNEVRGQGYTAGGKQLSTPRVVMDGNCFVWDFDDVVWQASTITADSALIYNRSKSKSLSIFSFPQTVSKNGAWRLYMPAPTSSDGVVRFYF
jgi:hypothetical protein